MNQRKGKVNQELWFLISVSIHVQIIIEFLSTAIKFIEMEFNDGNGYFISNALQTESLENTDRMY